MARVPGTQGTAGGVGRMSDKDWQPRARCLVYGVKNVAMGDADVKLCGCQVSLPLSGPQQPLLCLFTLGQKRGRS